MGNIIISNDFITVSESDITVQSTATGFSKADVFNLEKVNRRYRMDSADKSDSIAVMSFDLGSAQSVSAIVLDNVNFDKVVIRGHDSDLTGESDGWDAASFTSGEISISNDDQTNRRKVFIPLESFNYRFPAIIVPESANAVGTYTSKWEIGRVGILDSYYTFVQNMSWGYQRGAVKKFKETAVGSGFERQSVGPMQWIGTLSFDGLRRISTAEIDLTTLNNYDNSDTMLFYENDGDASKVYFCLRDSDYMGTYSLVDGVVGSSIRLKERI